MYHAVNTENFTLHALHVLSQDNYFPSIFCVVFQIILLTFFFTEFWKKKVPDINISAGTTKTTYY